MRQIETTRFGTISEENFPIIKFDGGLPGFESETEFMMLPVPGSEDTPYMFLQSCNSPDLAFLMTNPFVFFPDYEFSLEDEVQEELGIKNREDFVIFTLITIPNGEISKMTANLMAPLVISFTTGKAKQIILEKSRYSTKHELFSKAENAKEEK